MPSAFTLGELLIFIGRLIFLFIAISLICFSVTGREKKHETFFGVSTAFKAQIYDKADYQSKVLAYLNKGEKVRVHLKHFKESSIKNITDDQDIDQHESKLGFYRVITKKGIEGFVQKNHLHLIYRDFRDQHYHLKIEEKEDLTDYRINEPLLPFYPLAKKNNFRLNLQARLAPSFVDNYLFPELIKKERFSNRFGAAVTYLKNATFDFEDRFYFGMVAKFLTFKNEFVTTSDTEYFEDHFSFTLGPTLFYESVNYRNMTISHGLEVNLEYRNAYISLNASDASERRKFTGYTVKPALVNQVNFITKDKKIGFNFGMRITARPKYELKSRTPSKHPEYWDRPDDGFYELEAKIYQTYFIGLQVYY